MKELRSGRARNVLITVSIIVAATAICGVLRIFSSTELPIPLIFVLAVLIISRMTDGFICGIITSIIAVFVINFAFTYPFLAFNFTISGYPFTFITLFVVSIITSTLTTQIKQQQKIRAEAEREKLIANFLRAISHDLRTPLTSIIGSTSAILDSKPQLTETQTFLLLSEIREDASWLIRMVENVLSITKIQGEMKIQKSLELLEELTGDIVSKFKKRYPDAFVNMSIPDDLVFIPMDATLIEQVGMNLLENAVLHGTEMTPIDFSVIVENNMVVFSVENDCKVIDIESLRKHVQGEFIVSNESAGSENRRNLGIGLSVCASIVKAHNGKMFARSIKGRVCVGFRLPLNISAEPVSRQFTD